MSERRQVGLGLVGFGEVGFHIAKGLRGEGMAQVTAYDSGIAAGGAFADLVRTRADEIGVVLVPTLEELAASSDILLGLTPGSRSLASARALAEHLGPAHLYADLASATPKLKAAALEELRGSTAQLADGSIMGGPALDGHRVEIIVSGPGAEMFRAAMVPWGMNIANVGERIGIASGIKIFRSVIAKGLEALLVECLLAAERHGISEAVLHSYGRFLDARPFTEIANFLVVTDVIHAERRAEEAAMSAEALRDAGIEPIVTNAAVARMRQVADMRLKAAFGGQVPAHYSQAIEAIAAHLKRADPPPSSASTPLASPNADATQHH